MGEQHKKSYNYEKTSVDPCFARAQLVSTLSYSDSVRRSVGEREGELYMKR
jgi:hypothetical protein